MKKTALAGIAVLLIVLSAHAVSAGYITIYYKGVNTVLGAGTTYTIDFSAAPFQLSDNLQVIATFARTLNDNGHMYVYLDSDTIDIYIYYDSTNSAYQTSITLNGNTLYSGSISFYKAVLYMISPTTMTIELYSGTTLKAAVNASLSSTKLNKIAFSASATTGSELDVNSVYVQRYSSLLTSLNVYDENTNAQISPFDFSEGQDYVRVFDPSDTYAARTYYATGSLNAYLVKLTEGRYYTIQTTANYANDTLQALRNLDGAWVLVGEAKLDSEGITSLFLADGTTYKFRVLDGSGATLIEAEKTTSPTNPTIYLASELTSYSTVVDPTNKFSWRIDPIDGFLYYNMTNNITVKFSSEAVTVSNVTLTLSGAGVSNTTTVVFNSTSGEFSVSVIPTQNNAYLYATIKVAFSDGSSAQYSKSFYVKSYFSDTNMTLLGSLKSVPQELGISTLGMTIIAGIIALIVANGASQFVGDRAGVFAAMLTLLFFTYAGWMDWRIVMVSLLAGAGFMVRRGEV